MQKTKLNWSELNHGEWKLINYIWNYLNYYVVLYKTSKDKNIFEKQQLDWVFTFIIFFSYFGAWTLIELGLKFYYFLGFMKVTTGISEKLEFEIKIQLKFTELKKN